MKVVIALVLCMLALPGTVSQACTNIPADNVYYLTSFCDKQTACGITCGNCTWFYAADSQRFGCKSTLNCQGKGKSVNLQVIDYGPNCALERQSGKPIIDASYNTCQTFAGSNSCGWSDRIPVTCKKVASPAYFGKLPLGLCTWDPEDTTLPYCHLPETKHKFNFDNIQLWVESTEANLLA
jgi:hypothetical protein